MLFNCLYDSVGRVLVYQARDCEFVHYICLYKYKYIISYHMSIHNTQDSPVTLTVLVKYLILNSATVTRQTSDET